MIKIVGKNWNADRRVCDMGEHGYCQLVGINRKSVRFVKLDIMSITEIFQIDFHCLRELEKITDYQKRRRSCNYQWWINLVYMQRIMAHYSNQCYITEGNDANNPELDRNFSCMGLNNRAAVMKRSFDLMDEEVSTEV